MRKLLVIALLSLSGAACGGKKSSTTTNTGSGAKTPDPKMQGSDVKAGTKTDGGSAEEDPCAAPH